MPVALHPEKAPYFQEISAPEEPAVPPVEISPSPAKNAPSRQPQVWTLKASIGVMMVPPIPIELLMRVIASALRRINQLFARTIGECMKPAENDSEITPR